MSTATKIGTVIGTTTAYIVHYISKGATPLSLVTVVYTHRKELGRFAVKHSLDKNKPDAIENNLFKCLEYID